MGLILENFNCSGKVCFSIDSLIMWHSWLMISSTQSFRYFDGILSGTVEESLQRLRIADFWFPLVTLVMLKELCCCGRPSIRSCNIFSAFGLKFRRRCAVVLKCLLDIRVSLYRLWILVKYSVDRIPYFFLSFGRKCLLVEGRLFVYLSWVHFGSFGNSPK